MKFIKTVCAVLCSALILSSCGSWSNLAKGTTIGAAGGAAGGALIGALIGKFTGNTGVGTAVGAAVGTAVGAGTGALIGNRMDNAAEAAALVAEGEAEYMRLLAEAYDSADKKDFYEFTLALDALEKSLTGGEKTIILDKDSPLAQILLGK